MLLIDKGDLAAAAPLICEALEGRNIPGLKFPPKHARWGLSTWWQKYLAFTDLIWKPYLFISLFGLFFVLLQYCYLVGLTLPYCWLVGLIFILYFQLYYGVGLGRE